MANALEKWLNNEFSFDLIAGDGYKQFQEEACEDLRRQAEAAGYTLSFFRKGKYKFSASVRDNETGRFVFVTISDMRFTPNHCYGTAFYRAMKNEYDWQDDWREQECERCEWTKLTEVFVKLREQINTQIIQRAIISGLFRGIE